MTDSIADRTYRAALVQWESAGLRSSSKPERCDFDHLNDKPDTIAAPTTGGQA